MGELLLRKALAIRARIAKIRASLPASPDAVAQDERLESFLAFQIFLLIQDSLDLGTHLVVAQGLTIPSTQREVFEALASARITSSESARAMGAICSLRNRIAHAYGELDPIRMVREAPTGLLGIETWLEELTPTLTAAT